MIFLCLLLVHLFNSALAIDGVITVLEAPLLKEPRLESEVVQWTRKGETLFLHPEIIQIIDEDQPVEFYKTLDRSGHTAYLYKKHVWVTTDDHRELTQSFKKEDPTDYRLQEPLPHRYPLIQPQGYRGQYLLSATPPSAENFPYNQKIAAKGYSYRYEFSAMIAKRAPSDLYDRWYVGGMVNIRSYYNNFVLNNRKSEENWLKLGIGPTVMNDIYRTENDRINWATSFLLYPMNTVNITQEKWSTNETQSRTYRSWSVATRSGLYYQRIHILGDVDFVAGLWAEGESSQKFRYIRGRRDREWWGSGGSDSFRIEPLLSAGVSIGLQSSY